MRSFLAGRYAPMLIGYVRVSKSDGSQTLDPQRDALAAAGIDPERIYHDLASGRKDDRPGLTACLRGHRIECSANNAKPRAEVRLD